jgi:hypothetical protein
MTTTEEGMMLLIGGALIIAGLALSVPCIMQLMDPRTAAEAIRQCANTVGCYAI